MAEAALDISLGTESSEKDIHVSIGRNSRRAMLIIDKSTTPHEEYTGPYEVDASFHYEKVLETDGKLMKDNVTVHTIPVYSVSNPYGGRTITIGVI